jgi:hypothetical protein
MRISTYTIIISCFFLFFFGSYRYKENSLVPDPSIRVKLTDSTANYAAMYVEVEEIDIYGEEQGWLTISTQAHYINVLSLTNGTEVELGALSNPHDDIYTKVMIRFGTENNLYLYSNSPEQDEVTTLTKSLVWKGPREVMIPIYREVPSLEQADVLLDFNVSRSVYKEGDNYFLQPLITLIENAETGITGKIDGAEMVSVEISNKNNSYSAYTNHLGNFLIRGIEEGVYDMVIIPGLTNENGMQKKYVRRVTVKKGVITNLDEIDLYSSMIYK